MRTLLILFSLLLLSACASQPAAVALDCPEDQTAQIDAACLSVTAPAAESWSEEDLEADEIYQTAVKMKREGELFALAEDTELEDLMRSLRKKEAFIDRKAKILGY